MFNGHGDDLYKYQGKVKYNFSSNIFSHADLSGLKQYLCKQMDVIANYPEPESYALEQMIAENIGVDQGNVLITNGATEAIYLIAHYFARYHHSFANPTFSEYEEAVRTLPYSSHDAGNVYWMCNPNNPTGEVREVEELTTFIRSGEDTYFIVDQSYSHYTKQRVLNPRQMVKMKNCILLYSMTKRYCIPGLRLGYIVADKLMIDAFRAMHPAWSVNALAIEAGKYLLEHDIPNFPDLDEYLSETRRLRTEINKIDGAEALDTETNFFLIKLKKGHSKDLKEYLVNHFGVLIRDASNFVGLNSHYIRVATQLPEENDVLVDGIKSYMSQL
ncbi:MAG: aminotransferase class I/II-fold pyridoxal phosphate-dependent enzyme [Phocaeicola sp.]|uniref:aminotransferase class I/II-fold pyridoxal phosphate-dependent enzyme n=1 Tax=Phocaeicola TaxID=909656 RepID=UPI00234F1429|nr:aminotransferase class I/II-fold pyridoxal phosphate-dependent enzyme [Phocaeicola oris]MCE2616528.1 aminotransferase class I/II-fold pyridoxal phosphate-dependent enzyme [Phocaeicola oris]